jgi:predicted PurR-regulated permease PerM
MKIPFSLRPAADHRRKKYYSRQYFISIYTLMSKGAPASAGQAFCLPPFCPRPREKIPSNIWIKMHETFATTLFGITARCTDCGIITFTALSIFKIPYPFSLIAAICDVSNVIPIFGPFIGAIRPLSSFYFQISRKLSGSYIIILFIQQLDGNV